MSSVRVKAQNYKLNMKIYILCSRVILTERKYRFNR